MSVTSPSRGAVRQGLGRDFHRLWAAYSVSEVGSALASGALPLIAVLVLHASTLQVTFLAALSGLASAAIALPLGSLIEFRAKRPVMIVADLARFAALGSVPLAAALGALGYAQLCVVGVVQTTGNIVFNAASGAHLKALVPAGQRLEANSRFETTFWTATSAGPPIGGLIITWLGATATLAIDAVSFLLSAAGVRRIRSPEPSPPVVAPDHHWLRDVTTGWRHIFAHPGLAALFWNSVIFGGCIMMAAPLMTVFMLRDLGLDPWQYSLALGIPGLGGIAGSLCTGRLTRRFGDRSVLLTFGVLRTLWLGLIPLAPPGTTGLVVIIVADFLLLFSAGVFNPTFVTYRMRATADTHMSRVVTAWSISSRSFQPLFIIAGGLLAVTTSTRFALTAAAILLLSSAVLLPWRARSDGIATDTVRRDPRQAPR
ncbi:MFS transporter [Nocardioides sp. P5_C9_2]